MKRILLATSLLCSFSTYATAGNLVEPIVAPIAQVIVQSGADWNGFYAGVVGASESGDYSYSSAPAVTFGVEGIHYGGFAGYNLHRGNMVFGVELGFTNGTVAVPGFPNFNFENFIDLNARVGYAAGKVLIYAAAGGSVSTFRNGGATTFASTGYNIGVGIDFKVTDSVFVGAEFSQRTMLTPLLPGPFTADSVSQVIKLRAGIQF